MGVLLVLGATIMFVRQWLADKKERQRMQQYQKAGRHLPPSLHPVINTDLCISSGACVSACPEQDVLGLVGGAGRLIHGAACVGHGRCAAECPVGAIRLVFGSAERGVDIPHVTGNFESSRAGVYVAGELGGMGLIRNAMRQGVGAARHAVSLLPRSRDSKAVDVLVVGAGPAGLGAALACMEAGATYALIEQGRLGGAAANYPRHKVIMTEPISVPLYGKIHRAEMTKEELLAVWSRIVEETRIKVDTGVKFLGLDGADGAFTVKTSNGNVAARKVILAIGRRGLPRKLDVPGEDLTHVAYELVDPEQYRARNVVVVGGGDSALEAACALVEEGGAKVTLVHRGEGFRAKQKNVDRAGALYKTGRLKVHMQATTTGITPSAYQLKTPQGAHSVPAENVLVLIGGELPTALLNAIGIRFEKWFGDQPKGAAAVAAVGTTRSGVLDRWLGPLLFCGGVVGLGFLSYRGWGYYRLSPEARENSPLHAAFRSSGSWGHGIGVVATLVMLTNFLYSARKRLAFVRRIGTMKSWLTVHVLVGLLAPAYIAFHATFVSKNFIASVSYYAVGAVVVTGLVGRYLYGRVQARTDGQVTGVKRLMRSWRVFHVLLALLMVVTIAVHIVVSLLFGHRWIFS